MSIENIDHRHIEIEIHGQVTHLLVGLVAGHLGEGLVELLADGLELLLLVAQLIFPGRCEHVSSLKT